MVCPKINSFAEQEPSAEVENAAHEVFNFYNNLYFSLPHKGFALPFLTAMSRTPKKIPSRC